MYQSVEKNYLQNKKEQYQTFASCTENMVISTLAETANFLSVMIIKILNQEKGRDTCLKTIWLRRSISVNS